jgi:hypothetical protein
MRMVELPDGQTTTSALDHHRRPSSATSLMTPPVPPLPRPHKRPQHRIEPRLIARTMRLEPAQHLGVQPDVDRLPLFRQPDIDGVFPARRQRAVLVIGQTRDVRRRHMASATRQSLRLSPRARIASICSAEARLT